LKKNDKYWREKLQVLKVELLHLEAESKDSRETVELDQSRLGRLSRIDAMQSQEMSKAIGARRKQALTRIDGAFERLEDGEFGFCLKCGDEVTAKRLEFDPTAIYCTNCSET